MQKFSAEPLTVHEGCGGELERVISAPAFQFKGKGWYVTDYGRGGTVPANGDHAKSDAKTESSAAAATESKPASAAESKPAAKPEKTAKER